MVESDADGQVFFHMRWVHMSMLMGPHENPHEN